MTSPLVDSAALDGAHTSRHRIPAAAASVGKISPSEDSAEGGAISIVNAPTWRYSEVMPSIQIKDVPDEVHAELRRRAATAGQSLQEYLLARLRDDALTPTVAEVFERIEYRTGGKLGFRASTRAVRSDRDAR
jgi:plasmid stability protein